MQNISKLSNINIVKSICIILENHESFIIPKDCIKKLHIERYSDTEIIFDLNVVDNGNIKTVISANPNISPLQRLNQYNDVVSITIELESGEKTHKNVIWIDTCNDMHNNLCQKTELFKYNELSLSIHPNNITLNIYDVLHLPIGTIVSDEEGNHYTVLFDEESEVTYLSNTIISDKILNSVFKIVQS